MDLTLHGAEDKRYIRSISEDGIQVGDELLTGSIVISPTALNSDWPPQSMAELRADHFEAVFEFEPELVLIGTGPRQVFLQGEMLAKFYLKGMGVEVMNSPAACRTFNVLVSEQRRVVAAVMPLLPQS